MKSTQLSCYLKYAVQTFLLKQEKPFLFAMMLTDSCNLACSYCVVKNTDKFYFTDEQAFSSIKDAYKRGHRVLYFTGGEPTLWESNGYKLKDLVSYALGIGFFEVFIFTNGLLPLDIETCHYIVTVDGPKKIHNQIRNNSYDQVIKNVQHSSAKSVVASMTLTKQNVIFMEDFVKQVSSLDIFKEVTFNFLTRNPEAMKDEGLFGAEKTQALDNIWKLKHQGYPISLSKAAYKAVRNDNWKRPIKQIEMATQDKIYTCCRQGSDPETCNNCGYLGCVEVSQVLALKPSAISKIFKLAS